MTATTMFFHTTDSNEPVQPPQACLQSMSLVNFTCKSLPSSRTTNKRYAQKAKYLLQEEADWRLHAMPEEAQYTRIQARPSKTNIFSTLQISGYSFLASYSWGAFRGTR